MSFLTDRRQVVTCRGKRSQEMPVPGQVLWKIFIDSYKHCLFQNKYVKYADDTISIFMKNKIHSEDSISPPPDPCQIKVAFIKVG